MTVDVAAGMLSFPFVLLSFRGSFVLSLVNILLANGNAHLKNWSLLYSDQVTPRLSPAYDIVTTSVYIDNERCYALNLGKTKKWYDVTYANFEGWAKRAGVP